MVGQKEIKNLRIIIFVIIACLVAAAAFFVSRSGKPAQTEQPSGIEVIEQGDQKIVRNLAEGYQVTVPREWVVPKTILTDEKIIAQYIGPDQKLETEMQDGVYIQLYTFDNPGKLSIQEWAEKEWDYNPTDLNIINIDGISVLKTIQKVQFGQDNEEPIIVDDSQFIDLSFSLDNKIYSYSCTAVGKNYLKYSQECERIAIENIKKLAK